MKLFVIILWMNDFKGGYEMSIYNEWSRLKGYEHTRDWYLAWKVYKFLYQNETLLCEQRYKVLLEVAEDIVVWHKLGNNPKCKYEDILDFYRFYVNLSKKETNDNFVLTDEIENYLYQIKNERERLIKRRILEFIYGTNTKKSNNKVDSKKSR